MNAVKNFDENQSHNVLSAKNKTSKVINLQLNMDQP